MNSDDLKVGDVCVIVPPATEIVGFECEIIGPEQSRVRTIMNSPFVEISIEVFGFMVRLSDGRKFAIQRQCLRKKPPKCDQDGELRTDFTPAEDDFVAALARAIEKSPAKEDA